MPPPCPTCGVPVERRHSVGRPPRFCSAKCRHAFRNVRAVRAERALAGTREVLAQSFALASELVDGVESQ